MAVFAARIAKGPFWAICCARSNAFSSAEPASTTCCTNPYSYAVSASILRPVYIKSFALAAPTFRGKRCVPPAPGIMASPVSGRPNLAFFPATTMSAVRAISNPPPKATPSTAAMTGTSNTSNPSNVPLNLVTNAAASSCVIFDRSFKSAPAEKILGEEDVRTIHRTSLGEALVKVVKRAWWSCVSIVVPIALAALGRLRVRIATPSVVLVVVVSLASSLSSSLGGHGGLMRSKTSSSFSELSGGDGV
mmetsp:Transcript_14007/g.19159  ORF Transcript_14007/g.19159 Transcript_14007/m.19159 type:complete len:248 (+) Transcript_14007:293-1036(+)